MKRRRRAAPCFDAAWAFALAVVAPSAASAATGRVDIVRPSAETPFRAEVVARLSGELAAEGFDVVVVDAVSPGMPQPSGSDRSSVASGSDRSSVASGSDRSSVASISMDREAPGGIRIEVDDVLTGARSSRHLRIDPLRPASESARRIAIEAVELLRASLLELLVERPDMTSSTDSPAEALAPDGPAARWAAKGLATPSAAWSPSWGLEAGVMWIGSPGFGLAGVGPSALGLVRLRRRITGPWSVRLGAAGLGASAEVEAPAGTVLVRQTFGSLELLAEPWQFSRIRPLFVAGAGVDYTEIEGEAAWPYAGAQPSQWAATLSLGVGCTYELVAWAQVAIEAQILASQPAPIVRALGADVARTGLPTFALAVSVVSWL